MKEWFVILSPKMSKNSFSRRMLLCINTLFAGAKQVESSSDIVSQPFCSSIGDQHIFSDLLVGGVNPL